MFVCSCVYVCWVSLVKEIVSEKFGLSLCLLHPQFKLALNMLYLTIFRIHGVNFDIRVQTPGKFASAQPIPHEII